MRGHIRDEPDGRRAAQDARRDAAAERRMGWLDLLIAVKVHQGAPGVVTIR